MTSERLEEMFKGDSADMCGRKFSLVLIGGGADTSSVRIQVARTPNGKNGISYIFCTIRFLNDINCTANCVKTVLFLFNTNV
jgi:hypothetical protein